MSVPVWSAAETPKKPTQAVSKEYRKRGIGSTLVVKALEAMRKENADEVRS